jgi:hypothetical protein
MHLYHRWIISFKRWKEEAAATEGQGKPFKKNDVLQHFIAINEISHSDITLSNI